jgi:hypothetical protein
MYTEQDLRRELTQEARDLASKVTFAQVKARAGTRRMRGALGVLTAALVPVLAAGTVVALHPAAYAPGPSPEPTAIAAPSTASSGTDASVAPSSSPPGSAVPSDGSVPPAGPTIATGLPVGDNERLVLFIRDAMNGLQGGLSNPSTGGFRPLQGGTVVRPMEFGTVFEVDDRRGGIIDYGVFGAADARIDVMVDGKPVRANTGRLAQAPDATVFWIPRSGVLVAPTGAPADAPRPDLTITARDAAGVVLGTAEHFQRSDGVVNRDDSAVPVGDPVRSGVTLADGGELVFFFEGGATEALLFAGSRDGTGKVTKIKGLGVYHRPPFDIGFYGGQNQFALPGGGSLVVGTYVGPADTVTMEGTNATQRGSGRWSAHPQMRIFWAAGTGLKGVARDAQGTVLKTVDYIS